MGLDEMGCDNTERGGGTDEEWRHECDDKKGVKKDVRSPTKRNKQHTINTNEECARDMHASDDDVRSDGLIPPIGGDSSSSIWHSQSLVHSHVLAHSRTR